MRPNGRRNKTKNNFRSGFELTIAEQLSRDGCEVRYEKFKLSYTHPERKATYLVDFELPNGIIIETKGRLTQADRKKMILVRNQNPKKDIRFVFMNANNKLYTGSNTTYANWCDKNNFKWADGTVPKEWIDE